MNMPGFFAEAALLGRSNGYRGSSSYLPGSTGRVVPAQNWGSFQKEGCTPSGHRQYSAILWNIPWGQSWEQACRTTPATIEGHQFSGATRCVNTGFNMWGQFDVPDASCECQLPITTGTACPLGGIFGLWCRDYCGLPEANRPVSGWYLCGICFGGEF